MRVLTVSHFYESHGGGIERVAGHLCRQFTRLDIEAAWSASDADSAPDAEMEVAGLGCINPTEKLTGLPMPIPGFRAIRTLWREVHRSDAVVIHDALYVTSIIAMLMAKACGKPAILIQHIAGIAFSSRILRTVMALANVVVTRRMLRTADALVFISDTVRHDLIGTPPCRPYQLFFNGVDAKTFHPIKEPAADNLMVGSDASITRRILFVGRYVEKKGLAVIQTLAASRPDLTFLLVGSGPIQPDQWKLANVHDLGPKSPEELARLYRDVDLLLLPSVGEGYPLVIQEAMACALPVVCGEPSNRADPDAAVWLRGVEIELADPEGSAARCAQAIDDLDMTPPERAAMARYASSRYDWEAMARGVLSLTQGKMMALA